MLWVAGSKSSNTDMQSECPGKRGRKKIAHTSVKIYNC